MSQEKERLWLQQLKAGDPVFIGRPYKPGRYHRLTVERVTRTQIRLHNGTVFDRERGRNRGGDQWNICYIVEPTPERIASEAEGVERDEFSELTNKTAWTRLPLHAIREISRIIKESRHPLEVKP